MPRLANGRVPAYRRHKASGQAVVTLGGFDYYLGPHGSRVSRDAYDRLIMEWLANGRRAPSQRHATEESGVTVNELMAAYLRHAEAYYRKRGQPTGELAHIKTVIKLLKGPYGRQAVADFGPLALKAVRQKLIANTDFTRKTINDQIGRIKRLFKWGVEYELVPGPVFQALQAVAGLRPGRSEAREPEPVRPVPDEYVDAIKPYVSRQVWAIVELQRLTGMRSGEVVIMRGCDLDTTGRVWTYRPERHKTEHHGHERIVDLGPRAQAIVREFLKPDATAYLFSPFDAVREQNARCRTHRHQPVDPPKTDRQVGIHYTTDSYRRAITRACDLADKAAKKAKGVEPDAERIIPRWHPHQLRHNFATSVRKRYGVETARILCGHRSAVVTELYAEADREKVAAVVAKIG